MQQDQDPVVFPKEETPFYQQIGLLAPRNRLVCAINSKQKSTKYYSNKQKGLDTLIGVFKRMKKEAFTKLKHFTKRYNKFENDSFLPGDLLRGNDKIIPLYLQRLKNQRVESYIRFRWNQNDSNIKIVYKLTNLLHKLVDRRCQNFMNLLRFFKSTSKKAKASDTLSDNAYMADTSGQSMSVFFGGTSDKSSNKSVSIMLTRVKLTSENSRENSFVRDSAYMGKPKGISIKELQKSTDSKKYRYSSVDNRWERVKIQHSVHRI